MLKSSHIHHLENKDTIKKPVNLLATQMVLCITCGKWVPMNETQLHKDKWQWCAHNSQNPYQIGQTVNSPHNFERKPPNLEDEENNEKQLIKQIQNYENILNNYKMTKLSNSQESNIQNKSQKNLYYQSIPRNNTNYYQSVKSNKKKQPIYQEKQPIYLQKQTYRYSNYENENKKYYQVNKYQSNPRTYNERKSQRQPRYYQQKNNQSQKSQGYNKNSRSRRQKNQQQQCCNSSNNCCMPTYSKNKQKSQQRNYVKIYDQQYICGQCRHRYCPTCGYGFYSLQQSRYNFYEQYDRYFGNKNLKSKYNRQQAFEKIKNYNIRPDKWQRYLIQQCTQN